MTNLEIQIQLWHDNTFGPDVDLPKTYRKLLEEIGELGQALIEKNWTSVHEEVGDCALVLAHIIRSACPDKPSLFSAMTSALDKCESRRYEHSKRVGK